MDKLDRFWVGVAATLMLVALAGLATFFSRYGGAPPALVITPAPPPEAGYGNVYIDGAVANPGLYPLKKDDSLADLLAAAGGSMETGSPAGLRLYVLRPEEEAGPQRIDLNRATAWLLAALPGIGPEKARSIVEYREAHGPFRLVEDLLKVPGIGEGTLRGVRDLVAVGE